MKRGDRGGKGEGGNSGNGRGIHELERGSRQRVRKSEGNKRREKELPRPGRKLKQGEGLMP